MFSCMITVEVISYVCHASSEIRRFILTIFPMFVHLRYIIPVPIIRSFISSWEENGEYVGFCSLGLSCQPTENVQLRKHFGMSPGMTGVLVSKINPLSDAHQILKKDDILLAFDGVPIASDGTGSYDYLTHIS